MRRTGLLVLAALLVSGCTSSNGGGASGPESGAPVAGGPGAGALNNTTLPAIPVTFELQGCQQLHTFFPFPLAVFAQLGFELPEGFTFASDNGQTADVFLAWWFCPTAQLNNSANNQTLSDVGSMFASIPVNPPASATAADPDKSEPQLDLVPLTWVVNNQLVADHLGLIEGLRDGYVDFGEVSLAGRADLQPLGGTVSADATASFGTFTVDCVLQAASGTNPAGRYRMWLAPDATATGWLDITNSEGATLGAGGADLRFQGDADAGAPPIIGGTSHVVGQTNVVVAHHNITAPA